MKSDVSWTPVTKVVNIPLREGRAVTVNGEEIAIFHLENRYLTIENKCPHKGGPLCDGIVSGSAVVCPLHGRRFDLETGLAVRASEPLCVRTFPTRVKNGIIFINFAGSGRIEEESTA